MGKVTNKSGTSFVVFVYASVPVLKEVIKLGLVPCCLMSSLSRLMLVNKCRRQYSSFSPWPLAISSSGRVASAIFRFNPNVEWRSAIFFVHISELADMVFF